MKKYFFNGLFLFAVLFTATSFFSSCKDNMDDEVSKLENKDNELQAKIDQLTKVTNDLKDAQKACETACAAARVELENTLKEYVNAKDAALRTEMENRVADLAAQIAALQSNVASLQNQINVNQEVLNSKIDANTVRIDQLFVMNQELASKVNTDLAALESKLRTEYTDLINTLRNDVTALQATVEGLNPDIAKGVEAWTWMNTAQGEISTMQTEIANLKTTVAELVGSSAATLSQRIDSLAAVTTNLGTRICAVKKDLAAAIEKYDAAFKDVYENIDNLNDALAALTLRVKKNEQDIQTLKDDLDKLTKRTDVIESRLNQLITSIIVQAVENPVFGGYNVPLGVQSNILFGQYGEATNNITFPSYATSAISEYNGVSVVSSKDFEMLGDNIDALELFNGELISEDKETVNVGTIYTTINPTDVDFSETSFTLVNSQDEESGVELEGPDATDKVLVFGSSRADNGFYEINASVPTSNLEALELPITVSDDLKQAVKDAFNNRSISDFAQLAAQLTQTIIDSQELEAYGLKAAWQYDDVDSNTVNAATYSNYEIAATVYKPLSYKFMYGTSIGSLPTVTPLSGFSFDKSQFTFNYDAPKFDFNGVTFNFNLSAVDIAPSAETITVKIDNFPIVNSANIVIGKETKEITVDIKNNIVDIEDAFNAQISVWNVEMQTAFKDAMKNLETEINTQIQNAVNDATGKVNNKIGDLIDQINSKGDGLVNVANKLIEKINSAVNSINNLLTNPNHYLQVMMVYEGSDGDFHHLSTSSSVPSVFEVAAGGNAITLYPTSYTAGILVPSYKKFVGVTNVWNASGSAQGGNADCKAALDEANSNEFMATVIDGNEQEVPVQVKAGYTYEVLYTSLDFHGVTSTRKYYIKVQ